MLSDKDIEKIIELRKKKLSYEKIHEDTGFGINKISEVCNEFLKEKEETKTTELPFGLNETLKTLEESLKSTIEGSAKYRIIKKLIDDGKEAQRELDKFTLDERVKIRVKGYRNGIKKQEKDDRVIIDQSEIKIEELEETIEEKKNKINRLIDNFNEKIREIEKKNKTIEEKAQFIEHLKSENRNQRQTISDLENERFAVNLKEKELKTKEGGMALLKEKMFTEIKQREKNASNLEEKAKTLHMNIFGECQKRLKEVEKKEKEASKKEKEIDIKEIERTKREEQQNKRDEALSNLQAQLKETKDGQNQRNKDLNNLQAQLKETKDGQNQRDKDLNNLQAQLKEKAEELKDKKEKQDQRDGKLNEKAIQNWDKKIKNTNI